MERAVKVSSIGTLSVLPDTNMGCYRGQRRKSYREFTEDLNVGDRIVVGIRMLALWIGLAWDVMPTFTVVGVRQIVLRCVGSSMVSERYDNFLGMTLLLDEMGGLHSLIWSTGRFETWLLRNQIMESS